MTSRHHLAALSDDQLLARVNDLVGRGRHILTDLLVHLAEIEARQLHLAQAFPTMHAYATVRLGFSDSEAYNCMVGGSAPPGSPDASRSSSRWSPTAASTLPPYGSSARN